MQAAFYCCGDEVTLQESNQSDGAPLGAFSEAIARTFGTVAKRLGRIRMAKR